jgi:hypothetical protein
MASPGAVEDHVWAVGGRTVHCGSVGASPRRNGRRRKLVGVKTATVDYLAHRRYHLAFKYSWNRIEYQYRFLQPVPDII